MLVPALYANVAAMAGAAVGGGATTQWDPAKTSATITISNAGLTITRTSGTNGSSTNTFATTSKTSGYFEVAIGANSGFQIGIDDGTTPTDSSFIGNGGYSVCYHTGGGVFNGGTQVATYSSFASGDVIGVCFKGGKVYFSKNGVWQGGSDPSAGTGGITPAIAITNGYPAATLNNNSDTMTANFGNTFTYAVPTGVSAWG